jgi:hypothetical protein
MDRVPVHRLHAPTLHRKSFAAAEHIAAGRYNRTLAANMRNLAGHSQPRVKAFLASGLLRTVGDMVAKAGFAAASVRENKRREVLHLFVRSNPTLPRLGILTHLPSVRPAGLRESACRPHLHAH